MRNSVFGTKRRGFNKGLRTTRTGKQQSVKRVSETQEDRRLTEYRRQVQSQNFISGLKAFCGLLGLLSLFSLAIVAILEGTEGSLFVGGALSVLRRFGKFAFFLACFWGLLEPLTNYMEQSTKERKRRNEMLAHIEQDPDWWKRWEAK